MSQLAAERPARGSNKPSLGGLIKSSLVYALLSAIPPTKRATVARPAGAAGAQSDQRSRRSAELKRDGSAAQDGRGRHASAPWQIPWAGWKDILWRTYARIGDDRLLAVAAGVVFYGLTCTISRDYSVRIAVRTVRERLYDRRTSLPRERGASGWGDGNYPGAGQ